MMKRLLLLPLLLLGSCQSYRSQPYDPVETVAYSALGHDPFWLLTIGDDRIILTLGDEGGRADGALDSYSWPRALPRIADGLRTWEAAGETAAITIEARPGPCEGSGGRVYEDHVRVRLSGRELAGCGGRTIDRPAG